MGELYIVATPIGNLKDISLRALEILKEVDLILAEDTRVTIRLLERYEIKKSIISYHQHSNIQKEEYILKFLEEGKKIALVSDSGTPGISDPGGKLIKLISERVKEVKIIPIPGASAVAAVASISGFPMERFLFLGFPPAKKKRKKFFQEVLASQYPVIIYESPHRIIKTLEEIRDIEENCNIILGRELTKKFETIIRGNPEKVLETLKSGEVRGEFVVVISKIL
jgi:16S rRNA (cytidine1402-2'-O)-methyltransferase